MDGKYKVIMAILVWVCVGSVVALFVLPYKALFAVLLGVSLLGLFVCYLFWDGGSSDGRGGKYSEVLIPEELDLFFRKHKPYLNPDYKISDLEKKLKVRRSAITLFCKKRFRRNFNQFLNLCRIVEVQRLQALPENKGVSVYKLCLQAGFKDAQQYDRAEKERKAINRGKTKIKPAVSKQEDEKVKEDLEIKKKPKIQMRV